MTSLNESSIGTAQDAQNAAASVPENLIEHPRGAEPGKPGRRDAFYFEQKTRLPDAADGKGRGGARYGRGAAGGTLAPSCAAGFINGLPLFDCAFC